jgi:uncharacterized membrane protein YvbJ
LGNSSKRSANIPRFFCESCGSEVPKDAKNCPKCGRYFASVRCPACGFIGEEALFNEGCPVCGYSTKAGQGTNKRPINEIKKPAGPLPLWLYIMTAVAFTAIVAAIFFKVFG